MQKSRELEAQKQIAAAAAVAALDSLKPAAQDTTALVKKEEVAPAAPVPTQKEPGSGRRSRRNPQPTIPQRVD
jgi:hypothetical protein